MSASLRSVLKDLIRKKGWDKQLLKQQMPRYWAEVVGPRIAEISEVRSLENGVLRVHVQEAAWRSEVTLRREDIRLQLNENIGEHVVKEIIVR